MSLRTFLHVRRRRQGFRNGSIFHFAAVIWAFFFPICFSFAQNPAPNDYEGKVIRRISVDLRPVFEDPANLLFKTANTLKMSTQEGVIRRELLFKEGDRYEQLRIDETTRQLRALRYLRKIDIEAKPSGDGVDLVVHVQDTWTLLPQFSFSSGTGRQQRSVTLVEGNLGGLGKRLEVGYAQDEGRDILSWVYEDNRLFGTNKRLLTAYMARSDGYETSFYLGRPIRNLFDRHSWYINEQRLDSIGRLFTDGEVSYIFRQRINNFDVRYTESYGDPHEEIRRISYGVSADQASFRQADAGDYSTLDLDPAEVSNDPALLARDRRYRGPTLTYEYIEPDYISMNYIDRFDRVEDYNLGNQHDLSIVVAPEALGSYDSNVLFSADKSAGHRFGQNGFVRGEAGLASRLDSRGLSNNLARLEGRLYRYIGEVRAGDFFLGRHTVALAYYLDYGDKLDRDRQFLVGADNALRGYPANAFAGDKRTVLNLEDRVYIWDNLFQLVSVGAAAFFDIGGATYGSIGDLYTNDLYMAAGVGLRFAFPRSSGGQVVRVDFGVPLRGSNDGSQPFEVRIVMAGGQLFSSRLRSESVGPENSNVSLGLDR